MTLLERLGRPEALPIALAGLLLAFCAFAHNVAHERLRRGVELATPRMVHNASLIEFLDGHRPVAAAYIVLYMGALTFVSARRLPRWAAWLTFAFLGSPCLVYLEMCVRIGFAPLRG